MLCLCVKHKFINCPKELNSSRLLKNHSSYIPMEKILRGTRTMKGTEEFLNSKHASKSFPVWEEQTYATLNFKEKNGTVWSSPPHPPIHELRGTECNCMDSNNQNGFFIIQTKLSRETPCLRIFQMTQVYTGRRAESTS